MSTPDEGNLRDSAGSALTEAVVASFADARSARFRELMTGLVRHIHAYARDVRLTEDEWNTAIGFLTATGKICIDARQEFILLSDVLGLSMTTVAVNAPSQAEATESTVLGPFFVEGSPYVELGGDIAAEVEGRACYVHGTVSATGGKRVPGARIDVWAADDEGFYDVQRDPGGLAGRAHLFADGDGSYDFWSVQPAPYPIPDDGPVGRLLDAAGRSPMRPAHIHYRVTAPGYRTLITHIFVAGDPHLGDDAVFGVKDSLVVDFAERPVGRGPRDRRLDTPWVEVAFDITLAPL